MGDVWFAHSNHQGKKKTEKEEAPGDGSAEVCLRCCSCSSQIHKMAIWHMWNCECSFCEQFTDRCCTFPLNLGWYLMHSGCFPKPGYFALSVYLSYLIAWNLPKPVLVLPPPDFCKYHVSHAKCPHLHSQIPNIMWRNYWKSLKSTHLFI